MPRPTYPPWWVFAPVLVLAVVAVMTTHGRPPAVALRSPVLWRVEVAMAVVAMTAPSALALWLGWYGDMLIPAVNRRLRAAERRRTQRTRR